ncbi:MAG: YbaK/EbsC family protein [Pseudomonadota bacterium]|nr:YbaK/EbsC family protein [Pseudomonadota bacterium]
MLTSKQLINLLKEKKYDFEVHEHNPLFTVQDSVDFRGKIEGAHSKNLFLKNKKKNFYLLSCEENDEFNLKNISKALNLGNVSFAKKEYLEQYLGIKPGSVSPFALLNDKHNDVVFFLEKTLYEAKLINFHPLVNTLTITMQTQNFIKFMIENNKKIHIFSSTEGVIVKKYE